MVVVVVMVEVVDGWEGGSKGTQKNTHLLKSHLQSQMKKDIEKKNVTPNILSS